MRLRWRSLALLLVLTAIIPTLVHVHQGWESQRCNLCRVQETPGLHTPISDPLAAPVVHERDAWRLEGFSKLDSSAGTASGRSPPATFFV